jgi:serine/threonine-protein kinase HipA
MNLSHSAVDLHHFVGWIFFNLYAGNNDSHAKNLSIYNLPGMGVTLTPFYDLMCTRMYAGLSQEFAFAVGGDYKPAALTQAHLTPLAQQLGMRPQFIAQQAADLSRRMPGAFDLAVKEVKPALPHTARALADRLQQFVLSTTKKLAARLAA